MFYKSLSKAKVLITLVSQSCSDIEVLFSFQGVSFSIGGEKTWREYLTIPNILKEFNPSLYGYSISEGLSIFKTSKFNVAELGAMSRDMPYMSRVLVKRMLSDRNVKPQHWKVTKLSENCDGHLIYLV